MYEELFPGMAGLLFLFMLQIVINIFGCKVGVIIVRVGFSIYKPPSSKDIYDAACTEEVAST